MKTKTTADQIRLKRRILECGIDKHQGVIDDFRTGIRELANSPTEVVQRTHELVDQLHFAIEEMNILYGMFPLCSAVYNHVQLGSVVVTDKRTFFVCVSVERFDVDGMEVFGLSANSPLYRVMEGLTEGCRFTYQDKETYLIEEVF